MIPRSFRIQLAWFLLAAGAAPVAAQQPFSPYLQPLPPTSSPPANTSPLRPGVQGWPIEELLPAQPATPPETIPPAAELPAAEPIDVESPSIAAATNRWFQPGQWVLPGKVSGGVELGINGSDGNSEALSFKTGLELSNKTDVDELEFDLAYTKATADGIETQHNALFNASYEWAIAESTRWNLFVKDALEYDEFKAFDLRIAINGGIGYHVIKTDTTTWKVRFGAGASTEIGGPTDDWVPEGVFGTNFKRQLSKRQKISLTSDYFPDWSDFANYRVVTKASYEVMLNEEHNLNLKLSINDRYDSTPNGVKPNDINYSILLLWKM